MKRTAMHFVLVAALSLNAVAQDDGSPEAMAVVKPGEVVRFDRDSIRDFGPSRSFEDRYRVG